MADDPIFIRKGEKIPRAKGIGDKKGYYPERALKEPQRGTPSAKARTTKVEGEQERIKIRGHDGKVRMVKVTGKYRQLNYNVPLDTPPHLDAISEKPYASVYHKWDSPGNEPETNAKLLASAIADFGKQQGIRGKVVKGKVKRRGATKTVFGQSGQRFVEAIKDDDGNVIGERPISREKDKEQATVHNVPIRGRSWARSTRIKD